MREILFRGKDYKGNWVYGSLVEHKIITSNGMISSYNILYQDENDLGSFNEIKQCSIEKDTVGQYSGINDSKGNKIYEGDVLEHTFTDITTNKILSTKFLVRFDNGMFGIWYKDVTGEWIEEDRLCNYLIELDKLEVVGNIFDNLGLINDVEWR